MSSEECATVPPPTTTTTTVELVVGPVKVYVQGSAAGQQNHQQGNKTVFVTCHDIGANHRSFYPFLEHPSMCEVRDRSVFAHMCLPGHEEGAPNLPDPVVFPSLEQLGRVEVAAVLDRLGVKAAVCLGEGAGANVMCRFALAHPNRCLGLVLVHCTSATAGVVETVKEKVIKRRMSTQRSVSHMAQNFLVNHKFGPMADPTSDAVAGYTAQLRALNPFNLAFYIEAFNKRTSLAGELAGLRTDALVVVGSRVEDADEADRMYRLMNKEKTSRLVLENVGDVMVQAPEKFARALILFCKGCGLLSTVNVPGFHRRSTLSSSPSTDEPTTVGEKPRKMSTMAELDQPRKMSGLATKVPMGSY